jgi:uncharacterized protein
MEKKLRIKHSVFIVLGFLFAIYGDDLLDTIFNIEIKQIGLKLIYIYSWWVIPIFLITGLLFKFKNTHKALGLDSRFLTAFIFSIITVSPMLISSAFIGTIASQHILILLNKTLFAGCFEELLFRGFLFGLLFRKCGWGFIPASILGALVFGIGHLYQGNSPIESLGVFTVTAMGAIWFAWLYIEWNNNLWIPIFMHTLMNFSWTVFDIGA